MTRNGKSDKNTHEYTFVASNPSKIDIQRICNEAEGRNAVLVVTPRNALLLLRQGWLDRFNHAELSVAGDKLDSEWGFSACWTDEKTSSIWGALASAYKEIPNVIPLSNYRCLGLEKDEIAPVLAELRAARSYRLHSIQVHVKYP